MSDRQTSDTSPARAWLGGGEMGERVRALDWSRTELGRIDAWPRSLQTTVRILLESRYPMFVWWGANLVNIYNDAYVPILGARHPDALGRSARSIWAEIWDVVGPQAEIVLRDGRATWNESSLLVVERHGFMEETYFTFSYSPVPDDAGGIGGVFCACTEDTGRVLGARRLKTLRDLGEIDLAVVRSEEGVCRAVGAALAANPNDVTFALIYLAEPDGRAVWLADAAGVAPGSPAAAAASPIGGVEDRWGFELVREAGQGRVVEDLAARFGSLPAGPWSDATTERAFVVPFAQGGSEVLPAGYLVAGISPRLAFDAGYRSFLELAAGQIATALSNARAYAQERRRAEALAELDRAKMLFFDNVSHEFRTPLTLMLGPLEDALSGSAGLPPETREHVAVAHRNAMRLHKLVNSLLDFSRIQAGRMNASYEPLDLAQLTTDLASNFSSACKRASLSFDVDCPGLSEPTWVDRSMWEKIVLNLLSNAFKFTFTGGITVSLRSTGEKALLRVSDTGVGIPRTELPRLFERFHRIEDSQGRTHEGTGIGLALVRELVALHGGTIDVESEPGRGSTFTVAIPRGRAHVPAEAIGSAREAAPGSTGTATYFDEVSRWLSDDGEHEHATRASQPLELVARSTPSGAPARPRILLADDNADMRSYVRRLLSPRYDVEAVADGGVALERALLAPPDLVLADVMMPGLNGFELLGALRDDEPTSDIPVLLLSARAGEEARSEGLEAGAHDYLVKPFNARELLARVEFQLEMARLRRAGERRFREFADTAPAILWVTDERGRCTLLSRGWSEHTGQKEAEGLGFGWLEMVHPDDRERASRTFRDAAARKAAYQLDYRLRTIDGSYRWAIDFGRPRSASDGAPVGYIGSIVDVHERRQAEDALRATDRRKDEFLAMMAHELRNPLAALQNGLSLLELEHEQEALDHTRQMMQRQLAGLVRLIEDLLDVSRINLGKVELRRTRVDLADILREALETCSPSARSERTIVFEPPLEPLFLDGDAVRLAQVFGNLLNNACKFTERGGSVHVAVERRGDEAIVTVADDGIGIRPDDLTDIFAMFAQARPRSDRTNSGLGIGLTLVKRLVELHRGTVEGHSEGPGRGSTFVVRLPIAQHTAPAGAAVLDAKPVRVLRILVADDHDDSVQGLAKLLRIDGHEVLTAADGEQALRAAEAFRPDIALLDIGMPKLDGYEVARRIRGKPWGRSLVLVAVTGWGQDSDKQRSSEAGFDRHLVKPMRTRDLSKILTELCGSERDPSTW